LSKPKWLKGLKTPEEKQTLRYHLHKNLARRQAGRPLKVIHASDVVDDDGWWCPREIALRLQEGKPPIDETVTTSNALVYYQGNALAQFVIQTLAKSVTVLGYWRPSHNPLLDVVEWGPRPSEGQWEYVEPRWMSEYSGVGGGTDCIVKFPGNDKATIVELKTLQKSEFQELKMPIGKHRLRTNFYMRLVAESSLPQAKEIDTENAKILYIIKGGWGVPSTDPAEWGITADFGWTPFKEFDIKRDDEQTDHHAELARELKLWRDEDGPMPGRICSTSTCQRAKRCHVRVKCWEMDG
jgi:hypothetical protein